MIVELLNLPDAGRAYFPMFSLAKRHCFWQIAEPMVPKVLDQISKGQADYSALEMSNLDLLAVPGIPYQTLLDIHRATGEILEGKRMRSPFTRHDRAKQETSRMRIAYLSGDFREHVINTFIRGLFNFHDREHFEIYCYSNTEGEDATTAQYQQSADAFIDIKHMTDVEVAERIHADGIHLLINLAGYTNRSRMEILSYKAAPVQMMYLGYPYTSGMSSVDYFISDPYLDGPKNAPYFMEQQLRLPESFVTFDRLLEQEIAPDPPFKQKGHLSFGCLVNPYKLTSEVVKVWSRILLAVPGSRIILNNPHYDFDQMREQVLSAFEGEGIDRARVDIVWGKHESGVHLRYYNDLDIALDTFPLTGGTTTHEALWMGVPLVTCVGDIYPHRLSYTILSNAGMDLAELIAFSTEEYIEKAVALAKNPDRIEALHQDIPKYLKTSIQCDPLKHTQHMEAAYLEAWNRKFPDAPIQFETEAQTDVPVVERLYNKALTAVENGRYNESKSLCRKIFKVDPENIETLALLGSVHLIEKNYRAAQECFELVLSVYPTHMNALNNLGLVYFEESRDFEAAKKCFKQVLKTQPGHVNSLMNLGNVHRALHEIVEAEACYREALRVEPENGNLLNNLGSLHARKGMFSEARGFYQKALRVFPDRPEILSNLMTMNRALGDHQAALTLVPRVLAMPEPGHALFPAYNCAKMYCFWDESTQLLPQIKEAIQKESVNMEAFIELNLALLATPGISSASHLDIHQKAARMIDKHRISNAYSNFPVPMKRTGRLKIGYLSPDFHEHVSNVCFRGLINFHDRDLFEIICYSNTDIEDEIAAQYRAASDHFVNVSRMSDKALADRIYQDGIHFLVDLAGYTTNGRLGVLSYRPAPIQMMYLGYPYTSGASFVDYFISDPYLNGPENAEYFAEKQLCLPNSFMSFSSLKEQPIDPVRPYEKNGFVTFGSMNNLYKLSPELITVWSRILNQVPDSKMIINHPNCSEAETRSRLYSVFEKQGIGRERIEIIWTQHPKGSHFYYYNEMDVILDSFPMTGGTTTIDAVWMGVPVLTQVGEIYPHRLSYSILKNIGIDVDALTAFSEAEYIEKAVALAKQPHRIVSLHRAIVKALPQSILADPVRVTRQMESAYIQAWNRKYREQPISRKIKENKVCYLPLSGGVEIAVRDCVDELETYVIKEQKGWFDPEYHFIQNLVQPGMQVLDIESGVGVYAVPLACKVGQTGQVWALTSAASDAQYLQFSKGKNAGISLEIIHESAQHFELDGEKATEVFSKVDFIRIAEAEPVLDLISRGRSFLKNRSPLIMFRIQGQKNDIQGEAEGVFKSLGYDVYRFVPGLDILAPFSSSENLDPFVLNLFAIKPDAADRLARQDFLVPNIPCLSALPGLEDTLWQYYLAMFPFAKDLSDYWIDAEIKSDSWEEYWVALNLYAQSRDKTRPADERLAALEAAYNLLVILTEKAVTLPRILSLIRVMIDLGKRETAVHFLNQVVSLFESGDPVELNEPFLMLCDEDAAVNPGEHFAEWLFASVLKQREKIRAFSTYFTGEPSINIYEAIRETPFYSEEIDALLDLIRLRRAGAETVLSDKKRASSC